MVFIKRAVFPQELTDMIIDNLRNDKASLAKTALVAGSWLSRSQMHLFRRVCVKGSDVEHFPRLAEFLRRAPQLGKHVLHLVLQGHQSDPFLPTADCLSRSPPLLAPHLLASLVARLPNLKSLQLHEVSFHGKFPAPLDFKPVKLDELIIMNAGSAKDTTNDLFGILSLFSEVKFLHLSAIEQDIEEDEDDREDEVKDQEGEDSEEDEDESDSVSTSLSSEEIPKNLHITALKLEDVACDVYLEALRRSESVSTLRSVEIGCTAVEDALALSALLHQAGLHIEHLGVDLSQYLQIDYYAGEDSDDIEVPDSRAMYEALEPGLAACTGLKSLNVGVSFSQPDDDGATYHHVTWGSLVGVLSSAPPLVRRITVELSAEEWSVSLADLDVDWVPIQTIWKRFEQLETATFTTAPGCEWYFSTEDKNFLKATFEGLCAKNVLRFEG